MHYWRHTVTTLPFANYLLWFSICYFGTIPKLTVALLSNNSSGTSWHPQVTNFVLSPLNQNHIDTYNRICTHCSVAINSTEVEIVEIKHRSTHPITQEIHGCLIPLPAAHIGGIPIKLSSCILPWCHHVAIQGLISCCVKLHWSIIVTYNVHYLRKEALNCIVELGMGYPILSQDACI